MGSCILFRRLSPGTFALGGRETDQRQRLDGPAQSSDFQLSESVRRGQFPHSARPDLGFLRARKCATGSPLIVILATTLAGESAIGLSLFSQGGRGGGVERLRIVKRNPGAVVPSVNSLRNVQC